VFWAIECSVLWAVATVFFFFRIIDAGAYGTMFMNDCF
jgi:hypothetical protein